MNNLPSLDGRRFVAESDVVGGEISPATTFVYAESDRMISATYGGGSVRRGFLVGTRSGDRLDFRYAQLNVAGETATGHCVSTITALADGRLRMDEAWQWESREGSGTSSVVELL